MPAPDDQSQRESLLTRRAMIARAGGALAAASVPALLMDGCGSSSSGNSATSQAATGQTAIGFFGFPGDDFSNSKTLKADLAARHMHIQTQAYPAAPVPSIIQLTKSGRASGIDIIDAYTEMVAPLDAAGGIGTYLQPIDTSKIPNLAHLIPELAGPNHPWWIGGKAYTVPVSVSPNSPVWASKRVKTPIQKWADLLEPEFKGRLGFISFPEINYALAVRLLNLNPGSPLAFMPKAGLSDAIGLMKKVKANARIVSPNNADSINALDAGDIDVIWGGYPGIAVLANQAKPQTQATYNIFPQDGNILTIQGWGVAAKAPHISAAYAAINAALSPTVQAEYNNFIVQGPSVTGVTGLDPALKRIYSAKMIGVMLRQFQSVVNPPASSTKYVTDDEWTSALASVTG